MFSDVIMTEYSAFKGYIPKGIEESMGMYYRSRYVSMPDQVTYTIADVYANEIAIVNVHFKSLTVMQVRVH